MTKKYFIELAEYNIWANHIVHTWFDDISTEQWERPVVSSFDSIAATALHIAGAETMWLDRLNRVENPVWLPSVFKGSKNDIVELWKASSDKLLAFVNSMDESILQTNLWFKRLNGDVYEMPHYQAMAHIFNHSTYHRGQLVTMMRQVGFTKITSTDLLQYFRK